MPTFCRHNRFIERCPICSKTLPGNEPKAGSATHAQRTRARPAAGRSSRAGARETSVRVLREGRAADDGYRSELVPGLRASADAARLAEEIAFSNARLLALATQPPGLYGEARALAATDIERATWTCFLIAYLCPLEGDDPFAGIRQALAAPPGELPDLQDVPVGPRSSHDPARGAATLDAYRQWVARAGGQERALQGPHAAAGAQALAFTGDPGWSPQRRFERVFERLALPGFARTARYELLVLLGRLGLYELTPDSLHLGGARGTVEDQTTLAAKRVFGIGDPLLLQRRADALAQASSVPIEALDLALFNWIAPQPATLGFGRELADADAFARAGDALGI
jgi:Alpha-glutamyl/putrescinyl thymine pyrophosphorylase clade 3